MWDAFVSAIIRFFDNRFMSNPYIEIVEYLKLGIEKERALNHKLINFLLESEKQEEEIDISNYKPLNSHVPFSVRRAQLEKNDRIKMAEMKSDEPA